MTGQSVWLPGRSATRHERRIAHPTGGTHNAIRTRARAHRVRRGCHSCVGGGRQLARCRRPHEPEALLLGAGPVDRSGTVNSVANDLIYHGGNAGNGAIGVETKPAVYLVYWGPEWASGFTTADADGKLYSSKTLQNYVNSFFANVGGSPWAGVQTQYCRGVPAGATSCAGVRAPTTSRTRRTS